MDSKFYVSYSAARLLKEKGYNEDVTYLYNSKCELQTTLMAYGCDLMPNEEFDNNNYAAPTKAEAIDWLDKKIKIGIGYSDLWSKWHYDITPVRTGVKEINNLSFKTRLEAEEAAIIKALELL